MNQTEGCLREGNQPVFATLLPSTHCEQWIHCKSYSGSSSNISDSPSTRLPLLYLDPDGEVGNGGSDDYADDDDDDDDDDGDDDDQSDDVFFMGPGWSRR